MWRQTDEEIGSKSENRGGNKKREVVVYQYIISRMQSVYLGFSTRSLYSICTGSIVLIQWPVPLRAFECRTKLFSQVHLPEGIFPTPPPRDNR